MTLYAGTGTRRFMGSYQHTTRTQPWAKKIVYGSSLTAKRITRRKAPARAAAAATGGKYSGLNSRGLLWASSI